jgi:uncharacterized membrane protein
VRHAGFKEWSRDSTPAAKFYNVFRKQLEHLPNISTHIHEAKVHEGDWENIGSVKQWEVTIGTN